MENIQEIITKEFENGRKLKSLHHYPKDGAEVTIDIPNEWLPFLHSEVHLLSPVAQMDRHLVYSFVEELIRKLPELKEEEMIDKELLKVVETLLLALDYLTHEQFIDAPFTKENWEEIQAILRDVFEEQKIQSFSLNANRPVLMTSILVEGENKVFCMDERAERTRLYMVVMYQKPEHKMAFFKQVGISLSDIDLKSNTDHVEYEDYLKGMTNHHLHSDLLFYLNLIKRMFIYLINSSSWRNNKLMPYDKAEIRIKLGI